MRHCECRRGGDATKPFVHGPGTCRVCWLYATGAIDETAPVEVVRVLTVPPQLHTASLAAPASKYAVVTLAVGPKGRDLLAVSGPTFQAAAKRWGCDFHAIEGDDTAFNIGEKLRLYDYVKAYDRTFYIDADVLISPTAPNPFATFPAGKVYAHDDLPWLKALGFPVTWIDEQTHEICESQGWPIGAPVSRYWNSGVWVVDREHAEMFKPPEKPYPVWHCSEQHIVNYHLVRLNIPVGEIGRTWNWMWWINQTMDQRHGVHVQHFAGMATLGSGDDKHQERLALMRESLPKPRTVRCIHLLTREEFRFGCGGWLCRHGCELGLPAVPGDFCQGCEKYVGDFNADNISGPSWV